MQTTTQKQQIRLVDADDMTRAELEKLDVEDLRDLFKRYNRAAKHLLTEETIQQELSAAAPDSPVEWVDAIRSVTGKCERCSGSGVYYWGACVNGKMSHSGQCNRCNGKGWVDNADCRRCYVYDVHAIRRAFGF